MKTILVPIDANKEADLVIKKALEVAEVFDAQVHLMHATSEGHSKEDSDFGSENLEPENLSGHEKEMKNLNVFKSKFLDAGINCEVHLATGVADLEILGLAERLAADLIIIGLIQHSALYKLFVGSVSNEVIKATKIPVLLIPVDHK